MAIHILTLSLSVSVFSICGLNVPGKIQYHNTGRLGNSWGRLQAADMRTNGHDKHARFGACFARRVIPTLGTISHLQNKVQSVTCVILGFAGRRVLCEWCKPPCTCGECEEVWAHALETLTENMYQFAAGINNHVNVMWDRKLLRPLRSQQPNET